MEEIKRNDLKGGMLNIHYWQISVTLGFGKAWLSESAQCGFSWYFLRTCWLVKPISAINQGIEVMINQSHQTCYCGIELYHLFTLFPLQTLFGKLKFVSNENWLSRGNKLT